MREHKNVIIIFAIFYSFILSVLYTTEVFTENLLPSDRQYTDTNLSDIHLYSIFEKNEVIHMISLLIRDQDQVKSIVLDEAEIKDLLVYGDIKVNQFYKAIAFYSDVLAYIKTYDIVIGDEVIDRSFYRIMALMPNSYIKSSHDSEFILKDMILEEGFDLYKIEGENVYEKYATGHVLFNKKEGFSLMVLEDDMTLYLVIDFEDDLQMDKKYVYKDDKLIQIEPMHPNNLEQGFYNMYNEMLRGNSSRVDKLILNSEYMLLKQVD